MPLPSVCMLPLLQPIRHCLHAFLSDADATRLMQTSRSTASDLLAGYTLSHVFTFTTSHELKRAAAVYSRSGMRINRVCLSARWNEPLLDCDTGVPLLPASLAALTIGHVVRTTMPAGCAADATLDGSWSAGRAERVESEADSDSDFRRRIQAVDTLARDDRTWNVPRWDASEGLFDRAIAPGALPHGLRFLQFNNAFNYPLEVGSIPDTVTVLQLGQRFDQPLATGHLPTSLRHLVLSFRYNRPLPPGVLPAGLQLLRLGHTFNQPLLRGALPPQLRQLSFERFFDQPLSAGVIPSSVTHMRLSLYFNQPLSVGSIPHGVTHLNLGERFNYPLPAGVLPSSLRELALSAMFEHSLQPGSLPDGLQVVAFHRESRFHHVLSAGVIPASVEVLSMGTAYDQTLLAGGVPETVKWLRLPRSWYGGRDLSSVLSSSTRVVWWNR